MHKKFSFRFLLIFFLFFLMFVSFLSCEMYLGLFKPVDDGNDGGDAGNDGGNDDTYSVSYFGNGHSGGSVPVDGNSYESGDTVTVLGNTGNLSKTGYSFSGWNVNSSGSGTHYDVGDTFTIGSSDFSLYAEWSSNPTYTVSYFGNGNSGGSVPVDGNSYESGDTVTVLGNTGNLYKTGYVFSGWNVNSGGSGTHYDVGDTFTIGSSDFSLYAEWEDLSTSHTDMVSVPGGTYTQEGEDWDDNFDSFSHTISSFDIGKYEVTYELWYTVYQWATSNGYTFENAGREGDDGTDGAAPTSSKYEPVTEVNWRDCIVWANAYSEMEGKTSCYTYNSSVIKDSTNGTACDDAVCNWSANGYRLPTEGEWQYAASYISSGNYLNWEHVSGDASAPYDTSSVFGDYAWYSGNSGSNTHQVGTKLSNHLGIFDMSGNVWEWCWDWYSSSYPTSSQTDYSGPSSGSSRIGRGGSWNFISNYLRVGCRYYYYPYYEYGNFGFRVVAG